MSKTNELTAAFALGVVAGGVAALLWAPEKGEVTRKRLKESAAEAVKTAAHTARMQAEAVKGAVAEGAKIYREQLEHAHV